MVKQTTEFEDEDSDRNEGPPHQLAMGYSGRNKAFTLVKLDHGLHHGYSDEYSRFHSKITAVPGTADLYVLRLITGFGSTEYLLNMRKKTSEHLMYDQMAPDQFDVTIVFKDTDVFE
jgi:hypothetical protein